MDADAVQVAAIVAYLEGVLSRADFAAFHGRLTGHIERHHVDVPVKRFVPKTPTTVEFCATCGRSLARS
jgi:hypothetical protein